MSDSSPPFQELLQQRLSRRELLQAVVITPFAGAALLRSEAHAETESTLHFQAITGSKADAVILPRGYTYDVVARWGDSLDSRTPDLDVRALAKGALFEPHAAELQARQFGTNCDAVHFFPLNRSGTRGVLCINNEYTDDALMFPGHPGFSGALRGQLGAYIRKYPQCVGVAQAAQGISIIEIELIRGRWQRVRNSKLNRRVTATTPIEITGPARGSALLRTQYDPEGERVLGTFGNCAGGQTPWGTYLSAEENIQDYFGNLDALKRRRDIDPVIFEAHRRFRMWRNSSLYGWEFVQPRFDLSATPQEPFRFGWIVEIDPMNPQEPPKKRTALGRFAHEAASPIVARNGQVAVYMGDDDKFEYVYKFVTRNRFNPKDPRANRDLLNTGVLYVARFEASGRGHWLPMIFDAKGVLNPKNGFRDQADVLIKARAAADVLGATPMDRPEDVQVNPKTGYVYVPCTENSRRAETGAVSYAGREVSAGADAVNPRVRNTWGHIVEIRELNDDHTALEFQWEVFLLAGDPSGGRLVKDLAEVRPGLAGECSYYASYQHAEELSPIGSPDNLGFDREGNLWIVTDGPQPHGGNNGCWACPTTGLQRGRLQQFMSGPIGAEVCGCEFTPDGATLFLSVQHPGQGGTLESLSSHWPDGGDNPPRASVIAIRKEGGGRVGS